jgi:hypothetical protein
MFGRYATGSGGLSLSAAPQSLGSSIRKATGQVRAQDKSSTTTLTEKNASFRLLSEFIFDVSAATDVSTASALVLSPSCVCHC